MKRLFLLFTVGTLLLAIAHIIFSYRKYNVILITIDTLRADHLSCYYPKAAPTPNIDRIAASGVLFKNSYCLIPITLPSHAAILTSRYPHELRVFNNGHVFDHRVPMISDLLEEKGYQTAAFVSLGVLKGEFGLKGAFNKYVDDFDKTNGRYYKFASEINREVLPWIEKESGRPFFAWVHYSDPHEPYLPINAPPDTEVIINGVPFGKYCLGNKEKYLLNFTVDPGPNRIEFHALVEHASKKIRMAESKRFLDRNLYLFPEDGFELVYGEDWQNIRLTTGLEARYFAEKAVMTLINKHPDRRTVTLRLSGGIWAQRTEDIKRNYIKEVQYVDKHVGELWEKLKSLGLHKKTIIVITSDHGEGLKTHGITGHVDKLWNEVLQIPLIVYYPNLGYRGKVATPLVNSLDIAPTLSDLLHIRNKPFMEGYSLKRYISWSPIDWITSREVKRQKTFAYTFAPEARINSFAVTDGKYKVIHSPNKTVWQWEAYDLTIDPLERRNLNKTNPQKFQSLATMRGLLEQFRGEAERAQASHKSQDLDEEQKEMMRALGYVED